MATSSIASRPNPSPSSTGPAAGVIHGWLDGDLQRGLRQGVVMAALCLSRHGDMLVTNPDEVASLLESATVSLVR